MKRSELRKIIKEEIQNLDEKERKLSRQEKSYKRDITKQLNSYLGKGAVKDYAVTPNPTSRGGWDNKTTYYLNNDLKGDEKLTADFSTLENWFKKVYKLWKLGTPVVKYDSQKNAINVFDRSKK